MMEVIPVIQGVMAVNNDDFSTTLSPDAERIALKLQSYLRSKNGHLLEQIRLNHGKERYYWSVMHKEFILVNGQSQLYLLPWEKDEKGQLYVYSPYLFAQCAVFLVPEEEIVMMGYN